jgi:cobalt transporter subunit CbtA
VIPLIQSAEAYESKAHRAGHGEPGHSHKEAEWQPEEGAERTSLTAAATVVTAIGFASILFGAISLEGQPMTAARGVLWGLAAFACFSLAPALGLPPQPPGVGAADVGPRQLWWMGTVLATAAGLYLLRLQSRISWLAAGGVACLALPHLIGAPAAPGGSSVPPELVRRFVVASLVTTGLFWLTLGGVGGVIYGRYLSPAPPQRL